MNMSDLTTIICKADPSISTIRGNSIRGAVFAGITAALARGEDVRLAGFGNFTVAERAAGEGRNPRTGEPVKYPEKQVPKFSAAKALKDALNPVRKVGGSRNSPMPQRKRA
jgi:DNA-binding protein HU-beta